MKNILTVSLQNKKTERVSLLPPLERFYRDLIIIGLTVVITILLVHIGALETLFTRLEEQTALGSFISGILFVSVFTIAPASIVLAELAQSSSLTTVALFGGLGAMLGDALIFLFVRDIFREDLEEFLKKHKKVRIISHLHFGFLRWLSPLIGALIIASPLPDELGITMLGLSKLKLRTLLPITFVLNAVGIFLIGLAARSISGL